MNIHEFIRRNRDEIDRQISKARNHGRENNPIEERRNNDEVRRQWILNEPGLYAWATSEGVKP